MAIIDLFKVIKGPVVSTKAYNHNKVNKVVLNVDIGANSPMIKEAVERLFDVKVSKVNTYIRKGRNRRVGRIAVQGSDQKRAVVTLAEGYSLNLYNQVDTSVATNQVTVDTNKN